MRTALGPVLVWVLVWVMSAGEAAAADWSQWRGSARDGVADASGLPAKWPTALGRSWSKQVGVGHSSPVVQSGRVYQMSREGDREVVRGFDLGTGRELWKSGYRAPYKVNSAARDHGPGPKATPAVSGNRLVTFGISGILSCWDTSSGARVWSHEFSRQHKTTSPLYGHAASPIIVKGRVIVHVGGHDDGALCGFDLASGKVVWRWAKDGPSYTSPEMVKLGGKPHLVAQSTATDQTLADTMADYWVRFAATGDPNGDGLSEWPVYTPDGHPTMVFGDTTGAGPHPAATQIDFVDEYQAGRRAAFGEN